MFVALYPFGSMFSIYFLALVSANKLNILSGNSKKKYNIMPRFIIALFYALPIVMMFMLSNSLQSETYYVHEQFDIALGSGVNSGFEPIGIIALIMMFVVVACVTIGLLRDIASVSTGTSEVKEIKVKKQKKEKVTNIDDFKL